MLDKTEDVPPEGRRWVGVDLSGARFHNVDLRGARFTGALLPDVQIDGYVGSLIVNGVDVGPLIRRELDERHPELPLIRSHDPDELRAGWAIVKSAWSRTAAHAATLPPRQLHTRVDGEWSYLETLRHLVFASDAWVSRCILGRDDFWPAGLAFTELDEQSQRACGLDPDADPHFELVLSARAAQLAKVDELLDPLTVEREAEVVQPSANGAFPPRDAEVFTVGGCLRVVLNEEWAHRTFAQRDLDLLTETG